MVSPPILPPAPSLAPAPALVIAHSGAVLVSVLEFACTFRKRFTGLQFRRAFEPGHGLLLVPCASVHTCFMRFSIDLVMLDRGGAVLRIVRNLHPWRGAFAPRGTHAVLELPAGAACVAIGDRLALHLPEPLPNWLMRRISFLPTEMRPPRATFVNKGAT